MTRTSIDEIMDDFPHLATLADSQNILLVSLARDGIKIEDEVRNSMVVRVLLNNLIGDMIEALEEFVLTGDPTDAAQMRDIQTRLRRGKEMGKFLAGAIQQARSDVDEASDALRETAEQTTPTGVTDMRRPPKDLKDEG